MIPAKISADKVESFYWLGGSDEKEEGNWFWNWEHSIIKTGPQKVILLS